MNLQGVVPVLKNDNKCLTNMSQVPTAINCSDNSIPLVEGV